MKRRLALIAVVATTVAGISALVVQAASAGTASNGYPYCSSSSSDPDGDGWGWENSQSCVVKGSSADPGSTKSASPSKTSGSTGGTASNGYPYCSSSSSDPDGDGWGWENSQSCIVKGSSADPGGSTTSSKSASPSKSKSSSSSNNGGGSSGGSSGGGSVSTTFPSATGNVKVSSTISVSGTFDGSMKRYYGVGDGGQSESQPAVFELASGSTIKNVIIGTPAGDGIHCLGNCTIENVWWEDVGEDAATFKSGSTFYVKGGGARYASDKVFQHNAGGTVYISNFYVENAGKLYRACGNCSSSYQRHVVMSNIVAKSVGTLAGININWGDTAKFSNITILGSSSATICTKYKGVSKGSEPTKLGTGADSQYCLYSSSDITYK